MKFINYYEILEISPSASGEEIVASYKKLSKRWHPDKNPGIDTTSKMQEIVAAKLILTDPEARRSYDKLYYSIFREKLKQPESPFSSYESEKDSSMSSNADPFDPELEKWMRNAHKQSIDITSRLINELREQFSTGLKGSLEGMKNFVLGRKIF